MKITSREAAAQLGVSVRTVQRWAAAGKIEAIKDERGRWVIALHVEPEPATCQQATFRRRGGCGQPAEWTVDGATLCERHARMAQPHAAVMHHIDRPDDTWGDLPAHMWGCADCGARTGRVGRRYCGRC